MSFRRIDDTHPAEASVDRVCVGDGIVASRFKFAGTVPAPAIHTGRQVGPSNAFRSPIKAGDGVTRRLSSSFSTVVLLLLTSRR